MIQLAHCVRIQLRWYERFASAFLRKRTCHRRPVQYHRLAVAAAGFRFSSLKCVPCGANEIPNFAIPPVVSFPVLPFWSGM
jgi:hypothetical protein